MQCVYMWLTKAVHPCKKHMAQWAGGVLVFGDSNATVDAVPEEWTAALGDAYVDKHPGLRARDAVDVLEILLEEDRPSAVVLMIGSNDRADDPEWKAHVHELTNLVWGATSVVHHAVVWPDMTGIQTCDGVHYGEGDVDAIRAHLTTFAPPKTETKSELFERESTYLSHIVMGKVEELASMVESLRRIRKRVRGQGGARWTENVGCIDEVWACLREVVVDHGE